MRGTLTVVVAGLLIGSGGFAHAQAPSTAAENPYQADLPFVAGQPVSIGVVVEGVRLDTITVTPRSEPAAGTPVSCDVVVAGAGVGERKATMDVVLLFEAADGNGIERLVLEPFKTKPGKDFQSEQRHDLAGDTLLHAAKIYVLAQVEI